MVNFLIRRPIAVIMAFLALLLIGIAAMFSLPVSLMPDIDIPVISVKVTSSELPARQLENTVVKPLRNLLKEVNNIGEMRSETRDGSAWIELRFKYGAAIDLASVQVNEKVDKAMNYFPGEIRRPEVVRASATDIPVFYLMVNEARKETVDNQGKTVSVENSIKHDGLALSSFSSSVIRKRLEQLPEVALVDMSGLEYPEIKITPKQAFLQSGALSLATIEQVIAQNNLDLGNLLIRDGQYQYNIRFNTRLRDIADVQGLPVNLNGKVVKLGELADINLIPQKPAGNIRFDRKPAVSLAIIKQADTQMAGLKKQLNELVRSFKRDYPNLEFTIVRDQTQLLEYSISNLRQNLLIGSLLAFLAMFYFLRERKAPWLIGVSIPVALIISMLIFYLSGLSINVISLSGLVLGVGMMIDNSIIVIDNITQHRIRQRNVFPDEITTVITQPSNPQTLKLLDLACVNGTNEIIAPLISSVLTTCAVFIPLVFMKGMAGALFFDEAMSVAIGLGVSLLVAITLLPVLFRILYRNDANYLKKETHPVYYKWYEKGLKFTMRHGILTFAIVIGLFLITIYFWFSLPVSRFPEVSHEETLLKIEWNEPVTLAENNSRIEKMLRSLQNQPDYVIEEAGKQQYLLNVSDQAGSSENRLYIKTSSPEALEKLSTELEMYLKKSWPHAASVFSESDNLFNLSFGKTEAPLIVRLSHINPGNENYLKELTELHGRFEKIFSGKVGSEITARELILLETDPEKLLFYEVDHTDLYRQIKSAFDANTIFTINDNNMLVPVSMENSYPTVFNIIQNISIINRNHQQIPLSGLVKVSSGSDLKTIVAGKDNEYFPVEIQIPSRDFDKTVKASEVILADFKNFDATYSGEIVADKGMIKELAVIVAISLLLLFFILSAQFESLTLPLIILIEFPIDLFGAFLFLKIFGGGINIMSAIGIIVMAGIIINDSILKIDTMNKLLNEGYSLLRAIMVGGHRRLKPILMTSLTTVLAVFPFLFQKGMGAELQKPLALTLVGGMIVGTLVSLFFIPLLYYFLKRKKTTNKQLQVNSSVRR